jgi:mono/diheme cytochrome c family protein
MLKQGLFGAFGVMAALALVGCEGATSRNPPIEVFPDMDRQGKPKPQGETELFSDKRASRPPVAGTVARGFLKEDDVYSTGLVNGMYVGKNPEPINADLVKLGQARFNTYCSPCHDRTGSGNGIVAIKSQGSWLPTSLLADRVRAMNDGEVFNVISNGRRSMPPYKNQVIEKDRWAIVAYVRALQRAAASTAGDVPSDRQSQLK